MSKPLEDVRDKFINYICSTCDDFGLNRFVAQLYGILYLCDKPISLDELTERSGSSKGNVSINIRELEKWGAVRKIWKKGSRKDYYEAELDIKKIISNKLKVSVHKRVADVSNILKEADSAIQKAKEDLTGEEKRLAEVYGERLKKIEELKTLVSNVFSLAEKIL